MSEQWAVLKDSYNGQVLHLEMFHESQALNSCQPGANAILGGELRPA